MHGISELTFSSEEIAANRQVWSETGLSKDVEEGHWAVTVSSQVFISDSISHMTPHWDQNAPYNAYCPLRSDSNNNRAPAGCVAIAAAEVLLSS